MSKEKKDVKNNSFKVRVYDDDLLTSLNELYQTGQFESMNDLMNRALAIGIEKMYLEFGKRKALSDPIEPDPNVSAQLGMLMNKIHENSLSLDDIFVMMNCIETMAATLYNIQLAQAKKEPINAELIESGYLSTLPASMQAVKNQMIKRLDRKRGAKK